MRFTDYLSDNELKELYENPGSIILFDVLDDFTLDKAINQDVELSGYNEGNYIVDNYIVKAFKHKRNYDLTYVIGHKELQGYQL